MEPPEPAERRAPMEPRARAGLLAGLALALLRSLGIRPINWLIIFVVDLFRALPPLVIIVLMYFGLPAADIFQEGVIGLIRAMLRCGQQLDDASIHIYVSLTRNLSSDKGMF